MTDKEIDGLEGGEVVRSLSTGTEYRVKDKMITIPIESLKHMKDQFELVAVPVYNEPK